MWSFFLILVYAEHAAAAKSLQPCPTLCDPINGSPSGCPAPGILQARTLEWAAISFSNARTWNVKVKSLSRVGLSSDPTGCSPPGSPIPGILQARVLEGVPPPCPYAEHILQQPHRAGMAMKARAEGMAARTLPPAPASPGCAECPPRRGQDPLSGCFHIVLPTLPLLSSWVENPFFGVASLPLSWCISSVGENISNSFLEKERRERNVYKS